MEQPHCASTYQASVCIILANIPLVRASHMAESSRCRGVITQEHECEVRSIVGPQ